MLDLCKCDVVEELDKKLASDIGLVARESFYSDEDGRGGNDEDVKGVDPGLQEESDLDGLRVGWGAYGKVHKWKRLGDRTWDRRGSNRTTMNVENN